MLQTHGQIRIVQPPLWVQTNYLLGGRDTAGPAHSVGHLCTLGGVWGVGLCFHFLGEQGQLKTFTKP